MQYDAGEYIVRQGAQGDTFYVIDNGTVNETRRPNESSHDQLVRTLRSGDYFGEGALISYACCLRSGFNLLFGIWRL